MSILGDYVQTEAEKKGVTQEKWLTDIAGNASKCQFATHIGRFANPDVSVTWQAEIYDKPTESYVSTSSVNCSPDIFVAANYLATASLLQLALEDGKTVYEHLLADDEFIRREFQIGQLDYERVRTALLAIKSHVVPDSTDTHLKQVYFPVGDGDYHLLTILPPSSLMQEVRTRVRNMESEASAAASKKSDRYGSPHKRIYNLTQTKFGGTKPQNISFGNNRQGGRSYMLPSLPPVLQKRAVVIPRRDFFQETLQLRDFANLFRQLHGRYQDRRNNQEIRQAVRAAEQQIMDMVLQRVYALRQEQAGWSDGRKLKRIQAVWLDDKYALERQENTDWQKELTESFARWFINTYQKVIKKDSIMLGDGELSALAKEFMVFIRDDLQEM